MQISRHWRLNQQRYGLRNIPGKLKEHEGRSAFGEISGEETLKRDHRLLGAMGVVHDGAGTLLLLSDEAKQESVGYGDFWTPDTSAVGRFGLPAGGQMSQERMEETIRRELVEELPAVAGLNLSELDFEPVSPYPIVVNQMKWDGEEVVGVNQITVVVAQAEISRGGELWKGFLAAGAVPWSVEDSASELESLYDPDVVRSSRLRPQVVVAAACLAGRMTMDHIIALNNISVTRGYQQAQAHDVPLLDGAITYTGRVNPALSREQFEYLGLPT